MNNGKKYGLDRRDNTLHVSEKQIERKLVTAVRRAGGFAPKFVSPGWDGVPDRILLFPGACIGFVELKAPGKVMRPLQERRKEQLERLGFPPCQRETDRTKAGDGSSEGRRICSKICKSRMGWRA